jgi:hypothetical protein
LRDRLGEHDCNPPCREPLDSPLNGLPFCDTLCVTPLGLSPFGKAACGRPLGEARFGEPPLRKTFRRSAFGDPHWGPPFCYPPGPPLWDLRWMTPACETFLLLPTIGQAASRRSLLGSRFVDPLLVPVMGASSWWTPLPCPSCGTPLGDPSSVTPLGDSPLITPLGSHFGGPPLGEHLWRNHVRGIPSGALRDPPWRTPF